MFNVIALRLYWLRQTADYEFDFEVKTSVREMSILYSIVNNFLTNEVWDSMEQEKDDKAFIYSTEKSEDSHPNLKYSNDEPGYQTSLYNVDYKFPLEIKLKDNVLAFITAVHLDISFNINEILTALNLCENITNKGRYFIYEVDGTLPSALYVYINDEGRWTFWFSEDSIEEKLITNDDLINAVGSFMNSLVASCREINIFKECFNLALSRPIFLQEMPGTLFTNDLMYLQESINLRKNNLLDRFIYVLSKK